MADFWRDSGYHLLTRDSRGHLAVTDDFLRAYIQRPEMRPVEESCDAERALHEALLKNPREAVSAARLDELADPDAVENYRVVLGFRDRLLAAGTLEECYHVACQVQYIRPTLCSKPLLEMWASSLTKQYVQLLRPLPASPLIHY